MSANDIDGSGGRRQQRDLRAAMRLTAWLEHMREFWAEAGKAAAAQVSRRRSRMD